MSDDEEQVEEKKFFVDRAKTGRASCKKCKEKLPNGELRLAKFGYNPFGAGPMKQWHHVECMFEVFRKQRPATAKIETSDDIGGWSDLEEEDQEEILKHLGPAGKATPSKKPTPIKSSTPLSAPKKKQQQQSKVGALGTEVVGHKDNAFREFRRLCAEIAAATDTDKTTIVRQFFTKGTDGQAFKGDLALWVRLLLPGDVKREYNLKSKHLIKLFSKIFKHDEDSMLENLKKGDVADTICIFFESSRHCPPSKKSNLSMHDVDKYLEELTTLTKEGEQMNLFTQMSKKCTSNDLKMIIRLVKHDLRINAGPKHILEAVHADAYQAFQTSRDINTALSGVLNKGEAGVTSTTKKDSPANSVDIMTPVLPVLAEACKSLEMAMKKCPNGMYSEINYDGERVQVHKQGKKLKYFSRNLKPIEPHKVIHFKDYILKAFPRGRDFILDSEMLTIDTKSGKPLPLGTLGARKKESKDANVCLFVLDCIYYNGKVLLNKSIKERRKMLLENMTEIPNKIMFSEMEVVHEPKDLEVMITKVFKMGLEGLILKDLESIYEPGKRNWLRVKKDYLFGGAMADSADLVVLGAWSGTGQKGGMMSVFLMGCRDPSRDRWCTVTKVHTGHDDKTLERLQKELQMVKISKEASRVPNWLKCNKAMIPDFVAKDPKEMPVWEITGAEFTQDEVHTANGISIRLSRVTRICSDKTWETATSLPELKELYKKSKDNSDFTFESNFNAATESRASTPEKETIEKENTPHKKPEGSVKTVKSSDKDEQSKRGSTEEKRSSKRSHIKEISMASSEEEEVDDSKNLPKVVKEPMKLQIEAEVSSGEDIVVQKSGKRCRERSASSEDWPVKKIKMKDSNQRHSLRETALQDATATNDHDSHRRRSWSALGSEDGNSTSRGGAMQVDQYSPQRCFATPADKDIDNTASRNNHGHAMSTDPTEDGSTDLQEIHVTKFDVTQRRIPSIATSDGAKTSPHEVNTRDPCDVFGLFIASEMRFLTDSDLYVNVKKMILDTITKGQEQQIQRKFGRKSLEPAVSPILDKTDTVLQSDRSMLVESVNDCQVTKVLDNSSVSHITQQKADIDESMPLATANIDEPMPLATANIDEPMPTARADIEEQMPLANADLELDKSQCSSENPNPKQNNSQCITEKSIPDQDKLQSNSDSTNLDQNKLQFNSDSTNRDQNKLQCNSDSTNPDQGKPQCNSDSTTPDQGKPQCNSDSTTPDQGKPQCNSDSTNPDQGKPQCNLDSTTPDQGKPQCNSDSTNPDQNKPQCNSENSNQDKSQCNSENPNSDQDKPQCNSENPNSDQGKPQCNSESSTPDQDKPQCNSENSNSKQDETLPSKNVNPVQSPSHSKNVGPGQDECVLPSENIISDQDECPGFSDTTIPDGGICPLSEKSNSELIDTLIESLENGDTVEQCHLSQNVVAEQVKSKKVESLLSEKGK